MSMNKDRALNLTLLEASADARAQARAEVENYMKRTGLTAADFARRIGYSESTFQMLRADRYHRIGGNDAHIIRKCHEYMAAHPVAAPRKIAGELYETQNVQLIRETFAKLLQRPRAFMLYAPPGSQKSFVLEHEVYAHNTRSVAESAADRSHAFIAYARENIKPSDMVKRIAIACGVAADGNIDRVIRNIRYEFTGKRVLLAVDEAQHMSLACFETIRELLDCDPYFSLLFSGSHDLFLKFERQSATLEQWNSRIARKVRLPGCTRDEARAIVLREVGHILEAAERKGRKRRSSDELIDRFIQAATVTDVYVPVPEGAPKATYINIRTLTTALDELRSQYQAEQPAPGPVSISQPAQKESAA